MHFLLWILPLYASCSYALSATSSSNTTLRVVHQFPNGTWSENITVRKNGSLLVTLITSPEVYQVDPSSRTQSHLVYRFPGVSSILGITELQRDVFAVAAGNYSAAAGGTVPGTYGVWKLDLRNSARIRASLITSIPPAAILNGLTSISPSSLLVADSGLGVVYGVNVANSSYHVALDLPSMKPAPGTALGVNGVRVFRQSNSASGLYLYYTNAYAATFWRVRITPNGQAAGQVEQLPYSGGLADDFALDSAGNAYVAAFGDSAIEKIQLSAGGGRSAEWKGAVITSDPAILQNCTSVQFGRGKGDRDVLYVSTSQGRVVAVYGAKGIDLA